MPSSDTPLSRFSDVWQRRRRQSALLKSRLLALHTALPDLLIRIDSEGTYLDVHAPNERDLAAPLHDIVGLNVTQLLPPEIAAKHLAAANHVLTTGEVYEYEYDLDVPSGHQCFDARLVKSGPNEVTSIIRNITERRRMQDEAEQHRVELLLERERRVILEQFIQDASHDLRTPITALTSTSMLLERYVVELKEQFQALIGTFAPDSETAQRVDSFLDTFRRLVDRQQVMWISAERLKVLINAMFDMIWLDTETTLTLKAGQFEDIIESVALTLRPEAEQRSVTLSLKIDPIEPVRLNTELMMRAVQNLISNALHYTPEGGRVQVSLSKRAGHVVFEVADTGIGIAPQHLSHIFQRFYRVDGSRRMHTGGSGLGLAITYRIVELHGGRLEVESVLGHGSTFCIRIPQV